MRSSGLAYSYVSVASANDTSLNDISLNNTSLNDTSDDYTNADRFTISQLAGLAI